MAGIMNKFLDFMKLGGEEDEYDEDYYEDEEEAAEKKPSRTSKRTSSAGTRETRRSSRYSSEDSEDGTAESDSPRRERSLRSERSGSKLVALNSAQRKSMEVRIQKPGSFDDSEELADMIIRGQAVVVNFEGLSHDDAQRIMDFLLGCIYAMDGKLNQVSKYIFLFSPNNVDVSGGDVTLDSNGVPVFNSQF